MLCKHEYMFDKGKSVSKIFQQSFLSSYTNSGYIKTSYGYLNPLSMRYISDKGQSDIVHTKTPGIVDVCIDDICTAMV